jgi:hypothetical protein
MAVTIEDIGAFVEQPIPREVPKNIRKAKLKGSLGIGVYFIGIFLILFDSIFVIGFFPWRIADEIRLDLGASITEGEVYSVDKTSMTVNKSPVYELSFRFRDPETNQEFDDVCYNTGGFSTGKAQIEYVESDPRAARVKGTSLNWAGYFGGFVAIFGIIGVLIVFLTWKYRRRAKRLLTVGEFAPGQITDVVSTNVRVNNETRYRIVIEYEHPEGLKAAEYHAYGAEVEKARKRKESGDMVGILFDPENPKSVMILDTLLGK